MCLRFIYDMMSHVMCLRFPEICNVCVLICLYRLSAFTHIFHPKFLQSVRYTKQTKRENNSEITKITATDINGDDESWDGSEDSSTHKKQTSPKAKTTIVLKNPRQLLSMNYQRSSGIDTPHYRYAIKYLKEEVRASPQKYAVGTADLVVEGMFLASLAHPNIIKVRGLPEGGVKSLAVANRTHGYFLILDRLFNTLSDEMYNEWKGGHLITVKKKYGFMTNKEDKAERNKNLAVRLKVAFDICGALQFLHTKNIIYRDLKPENLGFDGKCDIVNYM